MQMTDQHVYIRTFGCQMNAYDSRRIAGLLQPLRYRCVESEDDADLIVINTCAIRAKAEQKVYSYLGRLARLKKQRPGLVIAVGGCVAQQEGRRILSRAPYVDLVFGTHAVGRLADLLVRVRRDQKPLVDVALSNGLPDDCRPSGNGGVSEVSRFVTIMQGCDNFCAYCVVPYVRGREASRHPEAIMAETKALVAQGAREVVLLGQNVNSYGQKEKLCTFAELLARVNQIDGLERIRFTTSHPKDLSDDLIRAFATVDKLCPHIHLPVQSGADPVLARMNRRYTHRQYMERIDRLRQACPHIAVSTDFIVGFPGESDADFDQTLELIATVGFTSVFAFVYSDRPQAPAAGFGDKVDETVKGRRLERLLALQEGITRGHHQRLVGSVQDLLVEDIHQSGPLSRPQWSGRTPTNIIVHFPPAVPDEDLKGRVMAVTIRQAFAHCLRGELPSATDTALDAKGVCHAA